MAHKTRITASKSREHSDLPDDPLARLELARDGICGKVIEALAEFSRCPESEIQELAIFSATASRPMGDPTSDEELQAMMDWGVLVKRQITLFRLVLAGVMTIRLREDGMFLVTVPDLDLARKRVLHYGMENNVADDGLVALSKEAVPITNFLNPGDRL